MKYFAVLLPMKNEEKSRQYRTEHLAFLEEQRQKGKIFANGRFADGAGGLVIYQTASLEEATQLAHEDPYVLQGARDVYIHEWEMTTDAVYTKNK